MPRLRPIDINKLKNGDRDEATRVVIDLLMLTPRGESQRQRANEYHKFEQWRGKDACLKSVANELETDPRTVVGVRKYGYEPETVYYALTALGHNCNTFSEWNARSIIQRIHFEWGKAKVTRSSRRLYERCQGAIKLAIASGKLGDMAFEARLTTREVPDPNSRWNDGHAASIRVKIAAASESEAQQLLNTMFTHVVDKPEFRVSAWQVAEPAVVMGNNMEQVNELETRIERAQFEIKRYQEHIENMKAMQEAIVLFSEVTCRE